MGLLIGIIYIVGALLMGVYFTFQHVKGEYLDDDKDEHNLIATAFSIFWPITLAGYMVVKGGGNIKNWVYGKIKRRVHGSF